MDPGHFGLRFRPFRGSPDLDSYYPATTHESALVELKRAISDEEGLMLLRAAPGMGKTLLAHCLIERMTPEVRTAFLTHGSFRERASLLQAIHFDLDLPYQELTEQELRLSLLENCLECFRARRRTLIVVDEAHWLPAALLDELRLLANLEGKDGTAVQVLLLGLPSIEDAIAAPGMESFRQRLSVSCRLEPFAVEEAADYLLHQVRRCGGRPDQLFGEDVIDILSHASRGIPRYLNQSAHLALTLAQQAGATLVDAEAAVEAVTRLGLDNGGDEIRVGARAAEAEESLPRPQPPLPHEQGPPVFVYGGGPDRNDRPLDISSPRHWPAAPQRAG